MAELARNSWIRSAIAGRGRGRRSVVFTTWPGSTSRPGRPAGPAPGR